MSQRSLIAVVLAFCLILPFGNVTQAQSDISTLDLREAVQTLKLKSAVDRPDNFLALPVLEKKRSNVKRLIFTSSDKNSRHASIKLGSQTESYFLFNDVQFDLTDQLVVSSQQGLWEDKLYDKHDVKASGRLMIGPFLGDLDLHITGDLQELEIQQVYANPINQVAMELGFGASFDCHTNINCDLGAPVSDVKRSVMRIRMVAEEGVALCTGTLLNNTRGDRIPYVLTAFHCLVPPEGTITPLYDMWWFDFNYESFSCANPEGEPFPFQIQGAVKLAEWEDTDMMLLQITDDIPIEANVHYAGWNRDEDYEPDTTYLIHHPVGDIKKVSVDVDTAIAHDRRIGWNNGANSPELSHYINDFDDSTYEPGSSGAAIFDKHGRVLGQLHGGPVSDEFCSIGIGYSGRLSISWNTGDNETTRLRDWLDPLNSEPMSLGGLDSKRSDRISMSGRVVTADGISIQDVRVSLVGDLNASFLTGSDGGFVFDNLDPEGSYTLEFEKNIGAANGLSATDLVILRNHIIGRLIIEEQFTLLAGDVNGDQNISSTDLVQIRNLIIGRQTTFPSRPSWDFQPRTMEIDPLMADEEGNIILDIIGYKIGDVNLSANPKR